MSPFKKYDDESEESPTVIYSYYSGDTQQDSDYVNPWILVKPEDYYPL